MTKPAPAPKISQIQVNGLVVDVVRKKIKRLYLSVQPPDGRVRVSAPLRVSEDTIRRVVVSKLAWIERQRARIAEQPPAQARQYASGESQLYLGARYQLNVVERTGLPGVRIAGPTRLDLFVRPGSDVLQRGRVLEAWYRQQLKEAVPPLIAKWEPILGVRVAEWGIKRMKTRWGTCNVQARRICLNLALITKPAACLEFIVVHEMVHLLERSHNARFKALMDHFLPGWRLLRKVLHEIPPEG